MESPLKAPRAVIFDMDGTITQPILDFAAIKRRIGAGETPILEFLASIPDPARRRLAREKVDRWEREGALASTLNPGVHELLDFLRDRRIPVAILTRNTRESVDIVLAKHRLRFDLVVTADDDLPPKPSPEPVRHIARKLASDPRDVLVVGDFRFDVECGRAAGAQTAFLRNPINSSDDAHADVVIDDLRELVDLIGNPAAPKKKTGGLAP